MVILVASEFFFGRDKRLLDLVFLEQERGAFCGLRHSVQRDIKNNGI